MMSEVKLTDDELNRLTDLLLDLSAREREFLLDLFQVYAEDFNRMLTNSLPSADDFFNWDPRLLQQLIRDLSFRDIVWAFIGDKPEIFKLFGENISSRGRMILMEEIQAVKKERRRKLENNKLTPEQIKQLKQRKRLLLKLRAQKLFARREDGSQD